MSEHKNLIAEIQEAITGVRESMDFARADLDAGKWMSNMGFLLALERIDLATDALAALPQPDWTTLPDGRMGLSESGQRKWDASGSQPAPASKEELRNLVELFEKTEAFLDNCLTTDEWVAVGRAVLDVGYRLPQPAEGGAVDVDAQYQYGHTYTDAGGGKHTRWVTAAEFKERKPDGHMADGTPYWNYTQRRRRKAGPWSPVSPPTADGARQ